MVWSDLLGAVNTALGQTAVTESGTFHAPGGDVAVSVEFEREPTDASDVAGEQLTAIGLRSEFTGTLVGQTITILATTYTIVEAQPVEDDRVALLLNG